jgi:hypothetical protein
MTVSSKNRSGMGGLPHLGFDGGGEAEARSRGDMLHLHFKVVGGSML